MGTALWGGGGGGRNGVGKLSKSISICLCECSNGSDFGMGLQLCMCVKEKLFLLCVHNISTYPTVSTIFMGGCVLWLIFGILTIACFDHVLYYVLSEWPSGLSSYF